MSGSGRSYIERCYHLANCIQTHVVNFVRCLGFNKKKIIMHLETIKWLKKRKITEVKTLKSKEYNSLKNMLGLWCMNVLLQRPEDAEKHVWAGSHFFFALFFFFFFLQNSYWLQQEISKNRTDQDEPSPMIIAMYHSTICRPQWHICHLLVQQKNNAEAN